MTINFYKTEDEYGAFSNFSRHPVKIDGKKYKTTEHYFQSQKFAGTQYEDEVMDAKTPMIAAKLGRQRSLPLRKDWESVKDGIMRDAVHAKFTQHEDLKELLLSTNDEKLVEHTVNDSYWGDGGDGSGGNKLGIILMEVRSALRGK